MRPPFRIASPLLSILAAAAALAPFTANAAGGPSSHQDAFGGAIDACMGQTGEQTQPAALSACFYRSSIRVSRAARHDVRFETGKDADSESGAAYAAAADAAAQALLAIAGGPDGHAILSQIEDVVVTRGDAPAAMLSGGKLVVTVVPLKGEAGRPSVLEIEQAVRAGRLSPA